MTPEKEKEEAREDSQDLKYTLMFLGGITLMLVLLGFLMNSPHAPDCSPGEAAVAACAIDLDKK